MIPHLSSFLCQCREDVKCFGDDSCYSLAFGVPAALMAVALAIFICGRPFYSMYPPSGNIIIKVIKLIFTALVRKFGKKGGQATSDNKEATESSKAKNHWLDYAEGPFTPKEVREVQIVLKILLMFVPIPFFWALFDQQVGRWVWGHSL